MPDTYVYFPGPTGPVKVKAVDQGDGTFKLALAAAVIANLVAPNANTLDQRNGANSQRFNWYATYTDASNYARAFINATAAAVTIGTEKGGTGTAPPLVISNGGSYFDLVTASAMTFKVAAVSYFRINGTTGAFWCITAAGHLMNGAADNTYDLGTAGGRPRTIYVGTGIVTRTLGADPGTSDIPAGQFMVVKNTVSGTLKLWANDGGTMKSVALT